LSALLVGLLILPYHATGQWYRLEVHSRSVHTQFSLYTEIVNYSTGDRYPSSIPARLDFDFDVSVIVPVSDTVIAVVDSGSIQFVIDTDSQLLRDLQIVCTRDVYEGFGGGSRTQGSLRGTVPITGWSGGTEVNKEGYQFRLYRVVDGSRPHGGNWSEHGHSVDSGTYIDTLSITIRPVSSVTASQSSSWKGQYMKQLFAIEPQDAPRQFTLYNVASVKVAEVFVPAYASFIRLPNLPIGCYFYRCGTLFGRLCR
jgi:hypothetical protein